MRRDRAVRRDAGVVFEVVDGRAVLIDAGGSELITLNPVGTLVWEALAESGDAASIARRLEPRFASVGVDELERDVAAFLDELESIGVVTTDDDA